MLVSLFSDISTFVGYLMPKAILFLKEYYLTHRWEYKGFYASPKGICDCVKAGLEFKHAYYDSAAHHFNHYSSRDTIYIYIYIYIYIIVTWP